MSDDVTQILGKIESGNPQAAEQLLPLVYEELRKLAAAKMAQEKPGQTLQATALVHEAYIRLVDQAVPQRWESRRHFFAAAAEAMRRILVDRARHKNSLRAGREFERVELSEIEPAYEEPQVDLIALNAALEKLELCHPRKAELVKLRFFAGLTKHQAAEALGVNASTADLDWAYAKCWLRAEMVGYSQRAE
jgi:RNA polymerase sigma factor (TIGR02999 family)